MFNVSPSSPLRMRLLKVLLSIVEVSIPEEALNPQWTDNYRKSWSTKLHASSSSEDLLEILTILEGAIKRDYLASNFKTTGELLGSFISSGCHNDSVSTERIPVLPWVPHTTAAVAQRLMELDISCFYTLEQKLESEKDKTIVDVMKFPSKYGFASYSRGQRSRAQGRGHSRGGRSQGRFNNSISGSRKKVTATSSRRLRQVLGWKGKARVRGRQRARRSSQQKPAVHGGNKRSRNHWFSNGSCQKW